MSLSPSIPTALRTVARRFGVSRLVVAASVVTILLAMVQIATGPIYAEAITLGALQKTLGDAPRAEASVTVELLYSPEYHETVDELVREGLTRATDVSGAQITAEVRSETFGFSEEDEADRPSRVIFQYREGIAEHATVIRGSWPEPSSGHRAVALDERTADALGVELGDELTLTAARSPTFDVVVRIVGLYRLNDSDDPYWTGDEQALSGVVESASFRTYGPFISTRQSIADGLTRRMQGSWSAVPAFDALTLDEVGDLHSGITDLPGQLTRNLDEIEGVPTGGISEPDVVTGLPQLLKGADRSLAVTRSSVFAVTAELAVLAGYALLLIAGLTVEMRASETALLSSRGTSWTQLLGLGALEAAMLTIPPALVAPWIALWIVEGLEVVGPIASIGLELEPVVNREAYGGSILAALAAASIVVWPAFRSARATQSDSSGGRRQRVRSRAQSAGLDLALLLLAVLAIWQLGELGSQKVARVDGEVGVDPLLIFTPAVGLLAGAFLALRVVPLMARAGERWAVMARSVVPALVGWQIARRPTRYARSALLLILAIGLSFFAISYTTTWDQSQEHQGDYQVGADLRLRPNRRTNDSISDLHLVSAHEQVGSVRESMPVSRRRGAVIGSESPGEFVLLDASVASGVVEIRNDLATDFTELMEELEVGRPSMGGIALPGEPREIELWVTVAEQELLDRYDDPLPAVFSAHVALVVQDGNGMLHRLDAGELDSRSEPQQLIVGFTSLLSDASRVAPVYPLSMVAIELHTAVGPPPERVAELTIGGVAVVDLAGSWERVGLDALADGWSSGSAQAYGVARVPTINVPEEQPIGGLRAVVTTGVGFDVAPVALGLRPSATVLPEALPVVVTESWLETTQSQVGDIIRLPALQILRDQVRIVGTVGAFPTVDSSLAEAFVADLATIQIMDYEFGNRIDSVTEHWLALSGDAEPVGIALVAEPFESVEVVVRESRVEALKSDPAALGSVGAFAIGSGAAAIFAVVGFVVSVTVSTRQRLTEFALLRALGLSNRQLGTWLAIEQSGLVLVSILFGTLLGVTLTETVLPLISVTQEGSAAVPPLQVIRPWNLVAVFDLVLVAVLATVVTITSIAIPRRGIDSLLRTGEDS